MSEEIVIVESCQGFWNCIDPNTILLSLITLLGVFGSSLLTYYLTTKQHKNDVFINHKDFYSNVENLDKWLVNLSDRIVKVSAHDSLTNIEILKDEANTLDFLISEVIDKITFSDAPYPLRRTLFDIMRLTLQIGGYTTKLIEDIENKNDEKINISEVEKKYKKMNTELRKRHNKLKKYL